jgi:hypothetical protein
MLIPMRPLYPAKGTHAGALTAWFFVPSLPHTHYPGYQWKKRVGENVDILSKTPDGGLNDFRNTP